MHLRIDVCVKQAGVSVLCAFCCPGQTCLKPRPSWLHRFVTPIIRDVSHMLCFLQCRNTYTLTLVEELIVFVNANPVIPMQCRSTEFEGGLAALTDEEETRQHEILEICGWANDKGKWTQHVCSLLTYK